jgi:2-polyprenyl-6-hydroxyphenyl methylase/3-demethylubiquinone-9 3-methyltransferase
MTGASTIDEAEIARFSALAETWWDPRGKMAVLHKFNPVRLAYIRDAACRRFERDPKQLACLEGLGILDIGCGGGILCEPLARLGAAVTGADPAVKNIAAAKVTPSRAGFPSTIAPPPPRPWPTRASASTSCWRWKWWSTSPT